MSQLQKKQIYQKKKIRSDVQQLSNEYNRQVSNDNRQLLSDLQQQKQVEGYAFSFEKQVMLQILQQNKKDNQQSNSYNYLANIQLNKQQTLQSKKFTISIQQQKQQLIQLNQQFNQQITNQSKSSQDFQIQIINQSKSSENSQIEDQFEFIQNQITLESLLQQLKTSIEIAGQKHYQTYRAKFHIGLKLFQLGKFTDSIKYYQQSQKVLYCGHVQSKRQYAKILRNIGQVYFIQSNYQRALDLFQRTKQIQQDNLNHSEDKISLAITFQCFGNLYFIQGYFQKAIQKFQFAKKIILENLSSKHREYACAQENIAICQQKLGNYTKSIQIFQQTNKILSKRKKIQQDRQFAQFLGNFGNFCLQMGKLKKAQLLFQKSSQILQKKIKKSHIQYTKTLLSLINQKIYIQNFDEAQKLVIQYFTMLKNSKQLIGFHNIQNANTYGNMAQIYRNKQIYGKAISYNQHCLKIKLQIFGIRHFQYGYTLASLGTIYDCIEQFSLALKYFSKSEQILKQSLGRKHPIYGKVLGSIGNVYKKLKEFKIALKYYQQYLSILQCSKMIQNIQYAITLINISNIYEEQQLFQQALKLNKKSLDLLKNIFEDTDHSLKIKAQQNLKRISQKSFNLTFFNHFFKQQYAITENNQQISCSQDSIVIYKVNQLIQLVLKYQKCTVDVKLNQKQSAQIAQLFQKIINLRLEIPQQIIQDRLDEQTTFKNVWNCNQRYYSNFFNVKAIINQTNQACNQIDLKNKYFAFVTERHQNILQQLQKHNQYCIFTRYSKINKSQTGIQSNHKNRNQQSQNLFQLQFQTQKYLIFPQFQYEYYQQSGMKPCNAFFNKLNLNTQLKFIRQVSQSLSSLHKLNIQHNDVKLQNIIYSIIDNRFKLIDFSLSRLRKQDQSKYFFDDIKNIEYFEYIDVYKLKIFNEIEKNKQQVILQQVNQSKQEDQQCQFLQINSYIQPYFQIYDKNQIKTLTKDPASFQKYMKQSQGKLDSLMFGFMILNMLYKTQSSLNKKLVIEQYLSSKINTLIQLLNQKKVSQQKIKLFFRNRFHSIILPFYKDILKLLKPHSIQRLQCFSFLINHFRINFQQELQQQICNENSLKNSSIDESFISQFEQNDFGLSKSNLSIYEKHLQILRCAQQLREILQQNQRTKSLSQNKSSEQGSFIDSWNSQDASQRNILSYLQQVD